MQIHRRTLLIPFLLVGLLLFLATPAFAQVGVLKVGFLYSGEGDASTDCTASGKFKCGGDDDSISLDDESGLSLGGDLLWNVGSTLRVGLGALYNMETALSYEGKKRTIGSDVSLHGVFEYVGPLSNTAAFVLRAQLGVLVLMPGGDYKEELDEGKDKCSDVPSSMNCTVEDGPFVGLAYGFGPGVTFALQGISLRAELLYQGMSLDLDSAELSDSSGNGVAIESKYEGNRVLFLIGAEFGGGHRAE